MTRFLMLIHFGVWVLSFSTNCASLSVEDQLQQIRENYMQIKEILAERETKWEAKVTQLETKVTRLEAIVKNQESFINSFGNEKQTNLKSSLSNRPHPESQLAGKSAIFRTCDESRSANPSMSSGMQWIDPDGQGIGDDPIYVYCDMTTGSTSFLHDSELKTDVGHCADPGCYSKAINYNATFRQMTALAELSTECHQSIRYDCVAAPLTINGMDYSWWNDRNGNPQYFWSGSNASAHTCQCGIEHTCVESFIPCNCDSGLQISLVDSGIITEKSVLPITRLNFGRTILETSSGQHTLGRFECTGKGEVAGMPSSCQDLWRMGHTLSGLYSVMGTEMIESVYCDFTRLPNDAGFQKWIGYDDVKTLPTHTPHRSTVTRGRIFRKTYFYVQKSKSFNLLSTPIPFEIEKLNMGDAMNSTSGTFTVPRTGIYFFSFTGIGVIPSSGGHLDVALLLNGNEVGRAECNDFTGKVEWEMYSLQSTLHVQSGDKIWLEIPSMGMGVVLQDTSLHYTHFNGWLLQEDISHSLNV